MLKYSILNLVTETDEFFFILIMLISIFNENLTHECAVEDLWTLKVFEVCESSCSFLCSFLFLFTGSNTDLNVAGEFLVS